MVVPKSGKGAQDGSASKNAALWQGEIVVAEKVLGGGGGQFTNSCIYE